jgi:mannose/fructose/N-acetylgalactosamine-specific phosphotransferase system component IIB
MGIEMVRVDDRLIHGQVVALWLTTLDARRIVVVDDATADDAFLREVVELAAPAGTPVEVLNLAAGTERLAATGDFDEKVLVLVRTPETALALRRAGIAFGVLNLGGLGAAANRRPLHRSISASPEELEALRQLEQLGTRVEIQAVPGDHPLALASIVPAATPARHP